MPRSIDTAARLKERPAAEAGSLAALRLALARAAEHSYDRAWSMPGAFYNDPGVLALERERIF